MKKYILLLALVYSIQFYGFLDIVIADSNSAVSNQEEGDVKESLLREPYPGEEITTKDGKKVRRWSTRGPVEVAPAPQPFDDPEQRRVQGGILLNVDPANMNNRAINSKPHNQNRN
jgi:hypothetical protein